MTGARTQPDQLQQLGDARVAGTWLGTTRRSGTSTFSAAERIGNRPKAWKMKATVDRRNATRADSLMALTSSPSTITLPDVGRSRPPSRLRSVVLPDPDRPLTATS